MEILKKIYNPKEIENKNGRIYYFDNLKFIAIFTVVLGHFIQPIIGDSNIAKGIWIFIYTFHMPLFIFISGYFAKASIERKDKNKIAIFFFLYLILKVIIFGIDKFIYGKDVTFTLLSETSISWYLFGMGAWYGISILTNNVNKKYLFIFSIILSIIIGYDKSIGDMYCLSRIITFYPFFLLGMMVKKERIESLTNNKIIKCTSVVFLLIIMCICLVFIDNVYYMRPLLTGRNSYYTLNGDLKNYGILLRSIYYIISGLIGIAFMSLIPKGKTFFSKFGSRTLAVYFLHAIVIRVFQRENIELRLYQYLIISIFVTFVFSLKWFSIPFNKIMKLNLNSECNSFKLSNKKIEYFIIMLMIIIISFSIFYFIDRRNIMIYKKTVNEQNYVAHALGGVDEFGYTNSKEALENSYNNGFRIFEADVKLTSDKKLVCVHGWSKKDYEERLGIEYNKKNAIMDYETFMSLKIQGKYTPLSFRDLAKFIEEHQDMYVMIDIGSKSYEDTKEIYTKIVEDCNNNDKVLQRLIVGGQTTKMIKAVKECYDFDIINLYWPKESKREEKINTKEKFAEYCKQNGITSLSVAADRYDDDFGKYMKKNNIIVYVFTENEESKAKDILKSADLVGTDFIQVNK